jgi:hypothetical protein
MNTVFDTVLNIQFMTFDDLNGYLGAADVAMQTCLDEEHIFTTNAPISLAQLTDAINMATEALTLEDVQAICEEFKKSRKKVLKSTEYHVKASNFLDDTLEHDITIAANNIFQYRAFRDKIKKDLIDDKLDIIGGIIQLKGYLEDLDACEDTRKRIDIFLQKMKDLNFYEVSETKRDQILESFEDATKTTWFKKKRSLIKAARGIHTGNLKLLLDKAIEYTVNSTKYWHKCHEKREELDNDKFVLDFREKLKVHDYQSNRTKLVYKLELVQKKLQKKIKELAPDQANDLLKDIASTKIPESLNLLKKTYGLTSWVYENVIKFDPDSDEEVDAFKEVSIEHSIESPKLSIEVDVPVFSCGVADLIVEFGASFGGSLEFKAALTLHNFLSNAEENYVSGSLEAKAGVKADAFVGVGITLVQLIKASGRFVLEGTAEVAGKAAVEIKKTEAENLAAFNVGAEAGLSFKLTGHLALIIGLTAPLKALFKTMGIDAEAKLETEKLDFFSAERKASATFELPFRKKPVAFPKEMFTANTGEWEVKFIGDTYLKQYWTEHFGKKSKWDEVTNGHPLSAKELEEIKTLYGDFGVRA